MVNDLGIRGGRFRPLMTLAVMSSIVAASIAEDGVKGRRASDAKLPEVVRTEEHEDVDGYARKADVSKKTKGAPTLQPSQIDELILKGLVATKTPVSEPTNDEEFIRRVYLDTLGRLPQPRVHPGVRQFPVA